MQGIPETLGCDSGSRTMAPSKRASHGTCAPLLPKLWPAYLPQGATISTELDPMQFVQLGVRSMQSPRVAAMTCPVPHCHFPAPLEPPSWHPRDRFAVERAVRPAAHRCHQPWTGVQGGPHCQCPSTACLSPSRRPIGCCPNSSAWHTAESPPLHKQPPCKTQRNQHTPVPEASATCMTKCNGSTYEIRQIADLERVQVVGALVCPSASRRQGCWGAACASLPKHTP